jgi:hypothetical protein
MKGDATEQILKWNSQCNFAFIVPKHYNLFGYSVVDFERSWWRLFQRLVVRTKSDIYVLTTDRLSRLQMI